MIATKIAYILDQTTEMSLYEQKRATQIQSKWPDSVKIFSKRAVPDSSCTLFTTQPELYNLLADFQPTLTIRDAGKSIPDDIRFMHQLGSRIAAVDDMGDGAHYADYQLQTLYTEEMDYQPDDIRKGLRAFIPLALPEVAAFENAPWTDATSHLFSKNSKHLQNFENSHHNSVCVRLKGRLSRKGSNDHDKTRTRATTR